MANGFSYAMLVIAIDGKILEQEFFLDIASEVNQPTRITVRSFLPLSGIEWDPRPYLGSDRTVHAQVHLFGGRETHGVFLEMDARVISVGADTTAESPTRTVFVLEEVRKS